MGSDRLVEEVLQLKLRLQASESQRKELIQQLNTKDQTIVNKQQSVNELTAALRQGILENHISIAVNE